MTASKPKIAFYWCASCGGCEETLLDLGTDFLALLERIEPVFWPVALDFKRGDVEALADGSIAAAFINGGIRNTDQAEMVLLLRRKAAVLIAAGACAQFGGVPGLANLWRRNEILAAIYGVGPPCVNSRLDGYEVCLAEFSKALLPLDRVVEVDYYIPGCPPVPSAFAGATAALLESRLPERGTVLGPDCSLCDDCPRRDSRPEQLSISAFRRPHEVMIDPDKCLLAQGLLCLGGATRSGCGARCVGGNMPCTGCFGPTSRVQDGGAKALSAIATLAAGTVEEEIARTLDSIVDPVGTFYRYSLATLPLPVARRYQEGKT